MASALTSAQASAQASVQAASPKQKDVETFSMDGNVQGWFETTVFLATGQTAMIAADGYLAPAGSPMLLMSPTGHDFEVAVSPAPLPGGNLYSLVAKAGGRVHYVGFSGEVTAERDTWLNVAVNDHCSQRYEGRWQLTVRIKRR
ncbi:MAG: hypothetical protein IAF08_01820 [Rhizobacter sp.]|nr:hypothetical protein [Chlorobiales bacterium]